jgi:hypothetical protein
MANIPMKRLPDDTYPDVATDAPGTFAWNVSLGGARRIVYVCPRGSLCSVPILPARNGNGAGWTWDGNEDRPTLTPSINCQPDREGGSCWHGFITNGEITGA